MPSLATSCARLLSSSGLRPFFRVVTPMRCVLALVCCTEISTESAKLAHLNLCKTAVALCLGSQHRAGCHAQTQVLYRAKTVLFEIT